MLGTIPAGTNERRTWEAATLLALRGRLRSGDIWVEGSRQWRAVENQLIAPALFQAMRDAGPLPVAVPATAAEYLEGRRALLDRRLTDVAAKAAADTLEGVRIKEGELKVTPLKAVVTFQSRLQSSVKVDFNEQLRPGAYDHTATFPRRAEAGSAPSWRARHPRAPLECPGLLISADIGPRENASIQCVAALISVETHR